MVKFLAGYYNKPFTLTDNIFINPTMEHSQDEIIGERRTAILESLGRKEGDVMEDEKGEYVMVKSYGQDFDEDEASFEKLYLSDVELD